MARAPTGELGARQPVDPVATHHHRAFGRRIETAQQVEQRRFARARRSHQGEVVAGGDIERDALQDVDALRPAPELLVEVAPPAPADRSCSRGLPLHSMSPNRHPVTVGQLQWSLQHDPLARRQPRRHLHVGPVL